MEKVERRLMEPISDLGMDKTQQVFNRIFHRFSSKLQLFLLHKGIIYALIGFLLGRAIILSEVLPFALPFFVDNSNNDSTTLANATQEEL